jgi:hypothetical protein
VSQLGWRIANLFTFYQRNGIDFAPDFSAIISNSNRLNPI